MNAPLLTAHNLTIRHGGLAVVQGVSLSISAGDFVIVLGANGAGKSQLLKCLHGLQAPSEGQVETKLGLGVDGRAFLFQRPELLRRSVIANLEYPLKAHGQPVGGRVQTLLETYGLQELGTRRAGALSGGEAQKVALARAAALEPQVMLLDEPTAALDPAATREIEQLICALNKQGTAMVMTTHDLAQGRRLAGVLGGRVVFMAAGRVVEEAEAARFFDQPGTDEAKAFLAGELVS